MSLEQSKVHMIIPGLLLEKDSLWAKCVAERERAPFPDYLLGVESWIQQVHASQVDLALNLMKPR